MSNLTQEECFDQLNKRDVKKELYRGGYFRIQEVSGLPQGVSLWVKPEGEWWEYQNIIEYLGAFVHDIEGQDINYGIGLFYFRAHKNKNVKSYLQKNAKDLVKKVEVRDSNDWSARAKKSPKKEKHRSIKRA